MPRVGNEWKWHRRPIAMPRHSRLRCRAWTATANGTVKSQLSVSLSICVDALTRREPPFCEPSAASHLACHLLKAGRDAAARLNSWQWTIWLPRADLPVTDQVICLLQSRWSSLCWSSPVDHPRRDAMLFSLNRQYENQVHGCSIEATKIWIGRRRQKKKIYAIDVKNVFYVFFIHACFFIFRNMQN